MTGSSTGPGTGTGWEAAPAADPEARAPLSWPSRAVALVGWAVVAVGALGALDRIGHFAGPIPWMRLAMWLVWSAGAHDLLIAPAVTLVAVAVARLLPGPVRGPVAGGLIASGCLVAVSWPRLGGYGRLANNSSILPGDAVRDLAVVLGVVWLAVTVTVVVRLVRSRSRVD